MGCWDSHRHGGSAGRCDRLRVSLFRLALVEQSDCPEFLLLLGLALASGVALGTQVRCGVQRSKGAGEKFGAS